MRADGHHLKVLERNQPDAVATVEPEVAEALRRAYAVAAAGGRTRASIDDLRHVLDVPGSAEQPARITPYPNGPYLLRGPFVIDDPEGVGIDPARRTVALCRCGQSKIRPFCDGTHKVVGFNAPSRPEDRA